MCTSKVENLILILEDSQELALTLNSKPLTTEEVKALCQQVDEGNEVIDPKRIEELSFAGIIAHLEGQVYQEEEAV